ncbi:MAG: hypothetical protein ACXWU5_08635 [Rhodoplanes sp.]
MIDLPRPWKRANVSVPYIGLPAANGNALRCRNLAVPIATSPAQISFFPERLTPHALSAFLDRSPVWLRANPPRPPQRPVYLRRRKRTAGRAIVVALAQIAGLCRLGLRGAGPRGLRLGEPQAFATLRPRGLDLLVPIADKEIRLGEHATEPAARPDEIIGQELAPAIVVFRDPPGDQIPGNGARIDAVAGKCACNPQTG